MPRRFSGGGRIMRVVVANDPRAYRDAISAALAVLRPRFEVTTAEPDDLDETVLCLSPHLVVCSRVTAVVEAEAPAWIELYPCHFSRAVVRLHGERSTLPGMDFETLLATADEAGPSHRHP